MIAERARQQLVSAQVLLIKGRGGMSGLAKPGRAKGRVAACELARNGPHTPLLAPHSAGQTFRGIRVDSCNSWLLPFSRPGAQPIYWGCWRHLSSSFQ